MPIHVGSGAAKGDRGSRSLGFSGGRSAQLGRVASRRRPTSLSTVLPGVSRARLDASGRGDLLVGGRRDEGLARESPAANVPSVSACARWPRQNSIPKRDRATANPTVWLRLPTAESLGLLTPDAVAWRSWRVGRLTAKHCSARSAFIAAGDSFSLPLVRGHVPRFELDLLDAKHARPVGLLATRRASRVALPPNGDNFRTESRIGVWVPGTRFAFP